MKDIFWRVINKIDFWFRYYHILLKINKADIILTATSAQTNLGDHAISIAEWSFFKRYLNKYNVVEIPKELYYKKRNVFVKLIKKNTIIAISGGGFLGDLWMTEEGFVRTILGDFKDNRIIILPQTIFFANKNIEYQNTFECYKNVKDIIINTREKNSYNLIRNELSKDEVRLIPDMVLSLEYKKKKARSNTALVCIRNDKENCLSIEEMERLYSVLKKRTIIKETTTIMHHIVPIMFRRRAVYKKLDEIASARIVITNRLHMMIFSAITSTPCIAIDNVSHKVSGVYYWLTQNTYIKLLDNLDNIGEVLEELLNKKECVYSNNYLEEYYKELKNEFEGGN